MSHNRLQVWIALGTVGFTVSAFCAFLVYLAWICGQSGLSYARVLDFFFSNPYGELNALQSLDIGGISLEISLLNLTIASIVVIPLLLPWHNSCFLILASKVSYHSLKEKNPVQVPTFVPLLGFVIAFASSFILTVAIVFDYFFVEPPNYQRFVGFLQSIHLQSLFLVDGSLNDALIGVTSLRALILIGLGVFVFRIPKGLRVAIFDCIIVVALIVTAFELLVLRSVLLGYSTPGFSFMYHTVIVSQQGFLWLTNLDALIIGAILVVVGSIVRWKLC